MQTKPVTIPARDGFLLSAQLYTPALPSRGFIQIHCGTGIPQKLYARFAAFLAESGFTVLTFDYRGIATSAPNKLKGFEAKITDWGRLDMTGVLDWAMDNFPNDKKIVIAHSMGGQMVGLMDNHAAIDHLILIAASTGYWGDMNSPYKWIHFFFWYFLIPVHAHLFGYVNANKVKQGENLPKGVGLQWRKWCTHPNYFEPDFTVALNPSYFNQITTPIIAIQILDDPIANQITANKLLKYFESAPIDKRVIAPQEVGVEAIGHTGFFSRKFRDSLWGRLIEEIDG